MVDGAQAQSALSPRCRVAGGGLRLFLDGLACVEEPAAMQVFSDEVGSAGRAFYAPCLGVSELVLATGG
jgi:hypothetical protein